MTSWSLFFFGSFPILLLVGFALLVMAAGLFTKKGSHLGLLLFSLLGIGLSFAVSLCLWKLKFVGSPNMLQLDPFAFYLYSIILLIGFLTCLNHYEYFKKQKIDYPEIYSLTLFALSGMLLMVSTTHLILFFLALETMSLAIYVLVGIKRRDLRSNEGAMKYFILGALVAGVFLYGSALIYGATGTLDLSKISLALIPAEKIHLFEIGALLILVAFTFKISAVPFHFWTPDVYEGAPVSVTGFMSTAVKATAFGAFLRFLFPLIPFSSLPLFDLLQGLSIATMIVGNLVALYQTNIKRMLAYSSIAHAGYILVGVSATYADGRFHPESLGAPLFYLFAYAVITVGAFAVASAVASEADDNAEYSHYLGLASRSPKMAAAMTIFMLALTGIPPTVGFAGKFFIFREAIQQGLYGLVIVGVLMSAVSAYYYLRVIVNMYFGKSAQPAPGSPVIKWALAGVILFCVVSTLYMGIAPSRYLQMSSLSGFSK